MQNAQLIKQLRDNAETTSNVMTKPLLINAANTIEAQEAEKDRIRNEYFNISNQHLYR